MHIFSFHSEFQTPEIPVRDGHLAARPIEMDDPGSVRLLLLGPLGMDLTMMQLGKAKRLGSHRMLPSQHMVSHVPVVESSLVIFWTFTNISLGFDLEDKKKGSFQVGFNGSQKNSSLNPRSALLVCSPYPQIRKKQTSVK